VELESRRFDDATALWDRMHCTPDLVPNNGSFEIVLNLCALTNQAERAFYVLDELRALGLSPDAKVFSALFRACAEAPHHVSGYEDTVEEAMCLMEGTEIYPTSEVYDSIIYAFSASGDYVSAEFYFWEMRRKGLPASTTTYANLLRAYSRNSALGLSSWGYQGRFLKRPERLNEKQKLVRKIPPGKLSKMSKSFRCNMCHIGDVCNVPFIIYLLSRAISRCTDLL
jgi:pentatricopeptide repeat protein